MRDIFTIFAAGSLLTAIALIAPTLVAAVQPPADVARKAFGHRLSQAGGEAPVSAVSAISSKGTGSGHGSALPRFARY